MNDLDVWTVSLMIRSDDTHTRADAFLQGPAVEVTCSAAADPASRGAGRDDLAAARALEELAGRLIDRAAYSRAQCRQEGSDQEADRR